ncbi:adaptor protein MecA [Furfurilactobacillus siliginis]|uniref:Adapter protein MecA n=2 Tax=Furfurilactobacillus siliginis TaxID=348151 RepID=A0A510VPL5_9LACO|nr:adaptor protein MecA [Furfurilactobacillus siliginis]GEK27981.1 adapter protein MecA [Furfurilactobacillus siliginis]
MEMERINENTIRVLIGNDDLSARGITVLDLLGNHQQIESFFYSILEEVDVDRQFQDNEAVTFQVLPNRNGLELFISKNVGDDADGDDAFDDNGANISGAVDFDSSSTDQVSDFLKAQLQGRDDDDERKTEIQDDDPDDLKGVVNNPDVPTKEVVLQLGDFEDLVAIAKSLRLDGAVSNLYKYRDHYYLDLVFFTDQTTPETIKDDVAVALEYANKTSITSDVLAEHGDKVMDTSALELARHYFK